LLSQSSIFVLEFPRRQSKNRQTLQDKSTEQAAAIANCQSVIAKLQGQLEAYKELPFTDFKTLSDGMESVAKATTDNHELISQISDSNTKIVDLLTTQLKREEEVATRVAQVKADLGNTP
jgi:hypothetical protein